jgi:hypothetical protein
MVSKSKFKGQSVKIKLEGKLNTINLQRTMRKILEDDSVSTAYLEDKIRKILFNPQFLADYRLALIGHSKKLKQELNEYQKSKVKKLDKTGRWQ